MNISGQLNLKQVIFFPSSHRTPTQKPTNFNSISCRANTMEAQRATTESTNFYELLSLDSRDVSFDAIKKAYRCMARQYHPDAVPASKREESTKRFVELQTAYETLSNPVSRQKYDYELGHSSRYGAKAVRNHDWSRDFCKEVWADQLSGLERKSSDKSCRRKGACI